MLETAPPQGVSKLPVLWLAILVTLMAFWGSHPPAGLLLLPYLLWVSFATYLNFQFWFSEKGAQFFFQVAAQSYERQSLIMTTNLDFSQWPQVFGSEQLTGALLDRLTHHAHILTMNGESFRFRESMSKKEG